MASDDYGISKPKRRPGNQVRHDECYCGHWRSSHHGWSGCLLCNCTTFRLERKATS